MSEPYVTPTEHGICTLCGFAHNPRDTPEAQRGRCELAQDRKMRMRTYEYYRYHPPVGRDKDPDYLYDLSRDDKMMDAYYRGHPEER